jgi:hypothetical protein
MLRRTTLPLISTLLLAMLWSGCSKTEQLKSEYIRDYHPLQVGKYITYRLDSTVYVTLNTIKQVHSYVIQDIVDAQVTDNLGRDAFRIRRMIRSNTDTTQWTDNTSYIIVPLQHSLELIDNNLRFIKLQEPIRDQFTWQGNNYINSYSDANLQFLDAWDYVYENVGQPYTAGSQSWPETISVNQRDEVLGTPDNKQFYWEINHSYEVFAKGIGLVYRDFLHEVWQPPNITSAAGYYEPNSYGIRLTFLNSNY